MTGVYLAVILGAAALGLSLVALVIAVQAKLATERLLVELAEVRRHMEGP